MYAAKQNIDIDVAFESYSIYWLVNSFEFELCTQSSGGKCPKMVPWVLGALNLNRMRKQWTGQLWVPEIRGIMANWLDDFKYTWEHAPLASTFHDLTWQLSSCSSIEWPERPRSLQDLATSSSRWGIRRHPESHHHPNPRSSKPRAQFVIGDWMAYKQSSVISKLWEVPKASKSMDENLHRAL